MPGFNGWYERSLLTADLGIFVRYPSHNGTELQLGKHLNVTVVQNNTTIESQWRQWAGCSNAS